MAMHSFAGFQALISKQATQVKEQDKLLKYSTFCEQLQPSLQFRDDLIDEMALRPFD
jgi:hypothetical protein